MTSIVITKIQPHLADSFSIPSNSSQSNLLYHSVFLHREMVVAAYYDTISRFRYPNCIADTQITLILFWVFFKRLLTFTNYERDNRCFIPFPISGIEIVSLMLRSCRACFGYFAMGFGISAVLVAYIWMLFYYFSQPWRGLFCYRR
jgi:hypothetical protein